MARITEQLDVRTDRRVAFDHVADFTTTLGWDPSIVAAERLDADPIGVGSRFRLGLKLGPVTVPLVYEVTAYDPPALVVLTTRGPFHRGRDAVRFEPNGQGTRVNWDATFELRGPVRWLDPLLGRGFRRTARASVAGLEASLIELVGR